MRKGLLFIGMFCSTLYGFTQEPPNDSFDELLKRCDLSISFPEGMHEIELEYLHKIPHHLALSNEDSSYQVRYYLTPLDTYVEDYAKKSKKRQEQSMNPNKLCKSMMSLAVLNASNNQAGDYQVSQYPELTGELYNADWEAFAMVEVGYEMVGYKYCYIWHLHKDDIADIYVYVLADSMDKVIADAFASVSSLVKFN